MNSAHSSCVEDCRITKHETKHFQILVVLDKKWQWKHWGGFLKKTGSRRRKVDFFFFTLAIKMTCVVSTRHKQLDDPAVRQTDNVFVEPGFKDETSPFPSACFYLLTFSTCLPVVALPGGWCDVYFLTYAHIAMF